MFWKGGEGAEIFAKGFVPSTGYWKTRHAITRTDFCVCCGRVQGGKDNEGKRVGKGEGGGGKIGREDERRGRERVWVTGLKHDRSGLVFGARDFGSR